jgi:hypothetical protein
VADEPRYRIVTHLGARVGRLNPSWQASPGQNAIFGPGNSEVTEVCVPSENSLWLKLVQEENSPEVENQRFKEAMLVAAKAPQDLLTPERPGRLVPSTKRGR